MFLSPLKRADPLWGRPSLLFSGHWGSSFWVKRLGCDVDHSLSSRAEAANKWRYTSTHSLCTPSWVDWNNFTFTFYLISLKKVLITGCEYFWLHKMEGSGSGGSLRAVEELLPSQGLLDGVKCVLSECQ